MPTRTDEELLLAAGRGDREAFGHLLRRQQRAVIHFVHRFLASADRATAEDVAQQVFLAAWRYAPTFTPRARPRTWLFRIATNACLNYRRQERARRFSAVLRRRADPEPDPEAQQAEGQLAARERARQVRAAVAALPATQRSAVVLRYFHGFSYAEIAEVMETSAAAVDALLHRARRALHRRLGAGKAPRRPQVSALGGAESI